MEIKSETVEKKEAKHDGKYIAVIRIRGGVTARGKVNVVMDKLRLRNVMVCALFKDTPSIRGQIRIVKDFVAWGEIDSEMLKEIIQKRGQLFTSRTEDSKGKIKYRGYMIIDNKKYKTTVRLSPPRKGFERKGIKVPFADGGALGYRRGKIMDLIKRML
jgi:large subunit ribosomal protein L30